MRQDADLFTKPLDLHKFHKRAKTVLKVVLCVSNVGESVSATNSFMRKISSCKAKLY